MHYWPSDQATDDYRLCSDNCLGKRYADQTASDCCCFRAARSHNAQSSAYVLRRQGEFFATPSVSALSLLRHDAHNLRHYRGITFAIAR